MPLEKYHDRIFYGEWMLNLRLTTVERDYPNLSYPNRQLTESPQPRNASAKQSSLSNFSK
jgi:hypothetical protein